jgi:protein phosphatase
VLRAWGVSQKGPVRPRNEDRFAIDEALKVCVVADGVGGLGAGDIAASIAIAALLDAIRDRREIGWPFGFDPSMSETANLIRTAIQMAHLRIVELSGGPSGHGRMATTIVAALVGDQRVTVGHVGDSRLYKLSRGRLWQLTGDDSWVASAMPNVSGGLLMEHPLRHALTNAVGAGRSLRVHVIEEPLLSGDILLLTTDGVHGVLDDRRLERLLSVSADLAVTADDIVSSAFRRGSQDDCTAVVARFAA